MPRVFAYARASTDKQSITLGAQKEILKKWFELRVLTEPELTWEGFFPDAAVSSKFPFFERPMGHAIFLHAQPGDVVLVSHLDRAFRSVIDSSNSMDICLERDLRLVILDVGLDITTIMGRAMVQLISVMKEVEREEIRRRTREAMQYMRKNKKLISKVAPIGWKRIKRDNGYKYVPFKEERDCCRQIVKWHDKDGLSFNQIWKKLRNSTYRTSDNRKWHLSRIPFGYAAAKCKFQRVAAVDLPRGKELKKYLDDHGGLPPLLEPGAVSEGRLHTLQPYLDQTAISAAHERP